MKACNADWVPSAATRLTIGLLALTACVSDKSAAPKPGMGVVRVIQASPDIGLVDVYVDNIKTVARAPFLADTGLPVTSNIHAVAIDPAGIATPAVSGSVNVSPGEGYDLVVTGPAASLQLLGGHNVVGGIDLSQSAAVRVINALADTGHRYGDSANIYVTGPTGSFATAPLAYANVHTYAAAAINANGAMVYDAIAPGTYHVKITAPSDTTTVAADSILTLGAGQARTIVVTPGADRSGAAVIIVPDAN